MPATRTSSRTQVDSSWRRQARPTVEEAVELAEERPHVAPLDVRTDMDAFIEVRAS